MAPSSNQRLQNALGGGSGGLLESLGGLLGGQSRAAGWGTFFPLNADSNADGRPNLAKTAVHRSGLL